MSEIVNQAEPSTNVDDPSSAGVAPEQISFDYIKSNFFRVVHVDGAVGGLTPQLNIQMAIFSERGAIPKSVVHGVAADGSLGEEIKERRLSRKSVVREVEADLVFSVETARNLVKWLNDKIKSLEDITEELKVKK